MYKIIDFGGPDVWNKLGCSSKKFKKFVDDYKKATFGDNDPYKELDGDLKALRLYLSAVCSHYDQTDKKSCFYKNKDYSTFEKVIKLTLATNNFKAIRWLFEFLKKGRVDQIEPEKLNKAITRYYKLSYDKDNFEAIKWLLLNFGWEGMDSEFKGDVLCIAEVSNRFDVINFLLMGKFLKKEEWLSNLVVLNNSVFSGKKEITLNLLVAMGDGIDVCDVERLINFVGKYGDAIGVINTLLAFAEESFTETECKKLMKTAETKMRSLS